MVPPPRPRPAARIAAFVAFLPAGAAIAGALLVSAACRAGTRLEDPAAPPTSVDGGPACPPIDPGPLVLPDEPPPPGLATVEPGAYEGDPRAEELRRSWPTRVERALERLTVVTGLSFPVGLPPRVILKPLDDEDVPHRVASEVYEGRRRAVVHVNLEPLAAGRADPDRAVVRALAAAVFEDTAARLGPPPAWVLAAAGTAAAGDLDEQFVRIARRIALGDERAARVDPADPRARESTAVAALALLLDRGDPAFVRTFFAFVADGDPADALLARTIQDPEGQWVGQGRQALGDRLGEVDRSAWRWLPEAERLLADAGRAALVSAIPDPVPEDSGDEARLLRARGAVDEGDYAAALAELRDLGPEAPRTLRDPGTAARLLAEAESHAGDADLGRRLSQAWRRDYPKAARALAGGSAELPDTAGATDLAAAAVVAQRLLFEHRIGAAQRHLDSLGEAASAPELDGIVRAVAAAWAEPSEEALEGNRARVAAWRAVPGEGTASLVRDGGPAAAVALADLLPQASAADRSVVVRMMAEAAGAERAIPLLVPGWRASPALLPRDLDTLAGALPYDEVRVWTEGSAGDLLAGPAAAGLWDRVRLGIDEAWLRAHPRVRRDLADPAYAVRKTAFDVATGDTAPVVSPLLVARGLSDPAALLRREAVRVAGVHGYSALLGEALRDEAWIVRQAAAASGRSLGAEAVPLLLPLLARDPVADVRIAAGRALADVAPGDPTVLDALVATFAEEDARVREDVMARIPDLPRGETARALSRALSREAARPAPRSPVLFRLFLGLRRATGSDPGYTPGMPIAELRRLVARVAQVAAEIP